MSRRLFISYTTELSRTDNKQLEQGFGHFASSRHFVLLNEKERGSEWVVHLLISKCAKKHYFEKNLRVRIMFADRFETNV